MSSKILAILMASGGSKRFGKAKAFLPFKDTNFLKNAILQLNKSLVSEVKIVANDLVFSYLQTENLDQKIKIILNKNPHLGQSQSIKMALQDVSSDTKAFMFCSIDQPLLTSQTIDKIIENFEKNLIVIPKFKNTPSLPTIFDKKFLPSLLSINGDVGGKEIIKNNPQSVKFVEFNSSEGFDVDTKLDYEKLILGEFA